MKQRDLKNKETASPTTEGIQAQFDSLQCCVIIPTYNNAQTLAEVIRSVRKYTRNILVVNDGSSDETASLLQDFPDCHVITHARNLGKGMALRNAFQEAVAMGYAYAISIDSDGQHMPEDLPVLLNQIEANPGALVVGARNMNQKSVPGASSFGNRFSSFWFRVETGIKLPDTQSGYRLYPIEKMKNLSFITRKFEFEIEVLVRSAWAGIPVISAPVQVYYAPNEERVSHFRPFRDVLRITLLNVVLFTLAFLFFRPYMYVRAVRKKGWQQIVGARESNLRLATAVGFGMFMGIFPIWGYQMIAAIALAYLFRLNKIIVVLSANISFPPFIPFIIYFSLRLGGLFFEDPFVLHWQDGLDLSFIKLAMVQYLLGALVLSVLAGVTSWLIAFPLFFLLRRRSTMKMKR